MTHTDIIKISKELLANGQTEEALNLIIKFLRSTGGLEDILNDAILLLSRYNMMKRNQIKGIASNAEIVLETNRIVDSTLQVVVIIGARLPANKMLVEIIEGHNGMVTDPAIKNADEKTIERLLNSQSKIRLLFLSANPTDTVPLRLDQEMRDIEAELRKSKFRDKFEFIKIAAVRVTDLQDALLNYTPNIIHFSGHGSTKAIALLDDKGETNPVKSEHLANLFKLFSNDIACVVLNSCYSKEQAVLINKYIPNVIGMNNKIQDSTAIAFAAAFYKGIGAGREISFSFELALNSLGLNNLSGDDTPEILNN